MDARTSVERGGNSRSSGAAIGVSRAAGARARCGIRGRHRGAALPVVLTLASMMLTTSSAWLEASLAATRRASNVHDHLRAAYAADAALQLCARALGAGTAPVLPAVAHEPVQWKRTAAFDGPAAFMPLSSWPGSARAPQCLIEAWRLASRPLAQAYVLTARGFGVSETAQAWLQLAIVRDAGAEKRHWRRIAARPL